MLIETGRLPHKLQRLFGVECKCAFSMCILKQSAGIEAVIASSSTIISRHYFFAFFNSVIMLLKLWLLFRVKFGFWSIVSKRIKMLEKNAFLQELLVRIYQKADRRCQIAQQSLKFLLWFNYSGLKACLCFKHFLIPKNRTQLQQWPFKWFISSQLRKQNGAC